MPMEVFTHRDLQFVVRFSEASFLITAPRLVSDFARLCSTAFFSSKQAFDDASQKC